MDSLNTTEIRKILDALGNDDILYCHIRTANFEVVLSADGTGLETHWPNGPGTRPTNLAAVQGPSAPISASVPPSTGSLASSESETPKVASASQAPRTDPNALAICAPMPGNFYRASDPASSPFVEVGSKVVPESTVGLIEAMKVFSAVRAAVNGTIVAIETGNDTFVEFGSTLMWVLPDS